MSIQKLIAALPFECAHPRAHVVVGPGSIITNIAPFGSRTCVFGIKYILNQFIIDLVNNDMKYYITKTKREFFMTSDPQNSIQFNIGLENKKSTLLHSWVFNVTNYGSFTFILKELSPDEFNIILIYHFKMEDLEYLRSCMPIHVHVQLPRVGQTHAQRH